MADHPHFDRYSLPQDIPDPAPPPHRCGPDRPPHPAGRGWVPQSRDIGLPGEAPPAAPFETLAHYIAALPSGQAAPPQTQFSRVRQVEFLEALSCWGNARAACRAAAVSAQTVYRQRRACAQFARAWDAALLVARAHVADVLADRAINGVEEEVFYHGEAVAVRRRYDARLLLAHLARLDRMAGEDAGAGALAGSFDAALTALALGAQLPAPPTPQPEQPAAPGLSATGMGGPMEPDLPPVEAALRALERGEGDPDPALLDAAWRVFGYGPGEGGANTAREPAEDEWMAGDEGMAGDAGMAGDEEMAGDAGTAGDKGMVGGGRMAGDERMAVDEGMAKDGRMAGHSGIAGHDGMAGDARMVGDMRMAGDGEMVGDRGLAGDEGTAGTGGGAADYPRPDSVTPVPCRPVPALRLASAGR